MSDQITLLETLRKGRESKLQLGDVTLNVRRPTDLESTQMVYTDVVEAVRGASSCVIGWDLKQVDWIPGGGDLLTPFSRALFLEWIEDRPALWEPLVNGIKDMLEVRNRRLEESKKN